MHLDFGLYFFIFGKFNGDSSQLRKNSSIKVHQFFMFFVYLGCFDELRFLAKILTKIANKLSQNTPKPERENPIF